MHKTLTGVIAALLLPSAALAQNNAPRPDPLDGKAAAPPLAYRSAFTGYKKLAVESPPIAWRDANDAVERIGGWRVYAREAQQPDATPAAKAADSPPAAKPVAAASAPTATEKAKPMPAEHGGHKMP